jgi:hypothetical protein
MWRQDGPKANTGALFLALSITKNLYYHHSTANDGYNRGRQVKYTVSIALHSLIGPSDQFVQLAKAGGRRSRKGHYYEVSDEVAEGLFCNNTYEFDHGVCYSTRVLPIVMRTVFIQVYRRTT